MSVKKYYIGQKDIFNEFLYKKVFYQIALPAKSARNKLYLGNKYKFYPKGTIY